MSTSTQPSMFSYAVRAIFADRLARSILVASSCLLTVGGYGTYRLLRNMSWYAKSVLGGGAVIAVALFKAWRYYRLRKLAAKYGTGGEFLRLLDCELLMTEFPSPGLRTAFHGECPLEFLRQRVQDIVHANPWLAGRLRTDPRNGRVALWIPPQEGAHQYRSVEHMCIEILVDVGTDVTHKRPPQDVMIKMGLFSVDSPEEPVARFAVVYCTKEKKFAVSLCMSHMIADGYTLHAVFGMLNPQSPVIRLNPVRDPSWNSPLTKMGPASARKFWWLVFSSRYGPFRRAILGNNPSHKPCHFTFFKVKPEWIEQEKERHKKRAVAKGEPDSFVSTNDVLFSWWCCHALGPGPENCCGAACFAVDLRNRIAGCTESLAGNYFDVLTMFPEQFEDSLIIRKCVSSLGHHETSSKDNPKLPCQPDWRSDWVANSTNWLQQHKNLQYEGCTQLFHAPCGADQTKEAVPTMIVYKCNDRGDIALYAITDEPIFNMAPCGDVPEGAVIPDN